MHLSVIGQFNCSSAGAFTDVGWAGLKVDRRSMTLFFLG